MRFLMLVAGVCISSFAASAGAAPPADRLLDLVTIPDVNGNSTAELAVLVSAPLGEGGSDTFGVESALYVRDAGSGAAIGAYGLADPGWATLAVVGVPDGETASIGALQRHSDGFIRVILLDAVTGALVRSIPYTVSRRVIAAAFVPDAAGPGVPGVAVLAQSSSGRADREIYVQVRATRDGAHVRTAYYLFQPIWDYYVVDPLAVAAIDDQDGNGSSEIAVLARRRDDGKISVVVRDARTGVQLTPVSESNGEPRTAYLSTTATPIGFAPVADASADGEAEIAVVGLRASGRSILQLREAISGSVVINPVVLGPTWEPRLVRSLGDVDGNGAAELAVAAVRDDGRITVDVHDGWSGVRTSRINFLSPEYDPRDLGILDDLSGDGVEDLALVGRRAEDGAVRIQIRDARSGRLLRGFALP